MGINYKGLSEPLRDGFSVTRLYRLRRFTEKRPFFFYYSFHRSRDVLDLCNVL